MARPGCVGLPPCQGAMSGHDASGLAHVEIYPIWTVLYCRPGPAPRHRRGLALASSAGPRSSPGFTSGRNAPSWPLPGLGFGPLQTPYPPPPPWQKLAGGLSQGRLRNPQWLPPAMANLGVAMELGADLTRHWWNPTHAPATRGHCRTWMRVLGRLAFYPQLAAFLPHPAATARQTFDFALGALLPPFPPCWGPRANRQSHMADQRLSPTGPCRRLPGGPLGPALGRLRHLDPGPHSRVCVHATLGRGRLPFPPMEARRPYAVEHCHWVPPNYCPERRTLGRTRRPLWPHTRSLLLSTTPPPPPFLQQSSNFLHAA